jgi:multiple sugar transport system substrate-binding protein
MPDLTNGSSNNSSTDPNSGTFSFQTQSDGGGQVATPTAPFETISYQTPVAPDGSNIEKPVNETVTSGEDIRLDQTDLSILKAKQTEELGPKKPEGSFLDRYKTEEIPETPIVAPSVPSTPRPTEESIPTDKVQPKNEKLGSNGYQMPDLPKSSIFGKLIPIGLFFLVIALAVFVGLKFLPGLSGAKPTELVWWGLWEDEKTVSSTIDAYKKIKPNVTIKYIKKTPKEYRVLLQSAIARDEGPDIFRFHNTWVPMLKVELGSMPERLKASSNFSTTFYPTAYFDLVQNNEIYGIPLMFDGLALYYNNDLLSGAGFQPPTGWTETADLAKKLTVKDEAGNIKISGLAIGNTFVDHWSDILGLMMLQNGADPSLPTDTCATEALNYFVSFTSDSKTKVWDDTLGSSTLAFANGKVAMYLGPSWEAFEIKKINPTLNFGISAFPQVAGGKRYWATYWAEGVNSKSKNSEAAWDFLTYLSKKESLEQMYAESSKNVKERLFGEIYPRVDMADLVKNDPLVGPFVAGAPQAKSWYLASRTHDDGINDRIIKYYEDAVNSVVKKEQTTEEALKTVSLGVAQVLKSYGVNPSTSNKNCQSQTPQ